MLAPNSPPVCCVWPKSDVVGCCPKAGVAPNAPVAGLLNAVVWPNGLAAAVLVPNVPNPVLVVGCPKPPGFAPNMANERVNDCDRTKVPRDSLHHGRAAGPSRTQFYTNAHKDFCSLFVTLNRLSFAPHNTPLTLTRQPSKNAPT